LMLLAGGLAALTGTGCAWLIAATRFPGRGVMSWALVLPLSVPAYIAAYIYADLLDFAGPVQSGLRSATGWGAGDYPFPDIRSLGGGALVLGLVLYPYVYLLARTAFATTSAAQFRAARSLGAAPRTAFWRVALPAARPAIAGGLALVLMEVLADFGVADYFAIPTFSTGIFRSWLAMGDKAAALKLAAVMLLFVTLLVTLEAVTRRGRSDSRDGLSPQRADAEPLVALSPLGQTLALGACLTPVLLGFVLPAGYLASLALTQTAQAAAGDLAAYARGSLWLGLAAASLCLFAALLLAFARARSSSRVTASAIRVATLGYARRAARGRPACPIGRVRPEPDAVRARWLRLERRAAADQHRRGVGLCAVSAVPDRGLQHSERGPCADSSGARCGGAFAWRIPVARAGADLCAVTRP
jgi:iron(III) transport system permease protein